MTSLHDTARKALNNAYAPYTGNPAGCAIELENGNIYSGSTVENAAYMHGIDALESAVGGLLRGEDGANAGTIMPHIKSVYHCFKEEPATAGLYYAGALSLPLLKVFAGPQTRMIFAGETGDIFQTYPLSNILDHWPLPPFDSGAVLDQARCRSETAAPAAFKDEPLSTLYKTRLKAFTPISGYAVGAMVETDRKEFYFGMNCEVSGNKALHAEGLAIARMVSECGPKRTIRRVTVLTAGEAGFPCGGCRQYIREFAAPDTEIVAMNINGTRETERFEKLLPRSFGQDELHSGSAPL